MPNIEEYEREWRTSVLNKLDRLDAGQNAIKDEMSSIKLLIPSKDTMNDLETRLRDLEKFKTIGQTAFWILQGLFAVANLVITCLVIHYSH